MNLSLTDAEREHLAAMGVTADEQGILRAASGREVEPGIAAVMLTKGGGISPAHFRRGPLLEHHAAHSAGQWTMNIPGQAPVARTGPAGPPGPIGSGTADRSMVADDEADALVAGNDIDGSGAGAPDGEDLNKAMVPSRYLRPYLTAGHAANSPGTTGHRGTTPAPHVDGLPGGDAHIAEPGDFTRGPLHAGHEADPPQNAPGGNNPHPGGTAAREVYGTAAGRYEANRAQDRADHLMPSAQMRAGAEPVPARAALPADMRASSVPASVQVAATKPAPGER